jgi:hypothetical protein
MAQHFVRLEAYESQVSEAGKILKVKVLNKIHKSFTRKETVVFQVVRDG